MKYYEALLKLEVFNLKDAQEVVGKLKTGRQLRTTVNEACGFFMSKDRSAK